MAFSRSLSRRWRNAQAAVPRLPALLVLMALNLGYFAWSQQGAATQQALLPTQINPAAVRTLAPEEVERLQAQPAAVSASRPKTTPALVQEYEDAPPKVVAPDR
jgi:hypothetical protein